jgi:2-polyprenyl-6-methoxyphenol hydroxylase-like FAD-dependent oxidoreductase
MNPHVLIAGAGPTGLVLALWLARLGVPLRIVDKNTGPGQASRAMAVQARTLEFYHQLGFAGETVRRGIKVDGLRLWEGNREVGGFKLGNIGEGLSPFPFILSFPQDDHERLLVEQLTAAGVEVEWNTELTGFTDADDRVRVTLRNGGTEETCEISYLCGCDGAHSVVRHGLNLGFPGGTYEQLFYVADVQATGDAADGSFSMCLDAQDSCAVLPVRSSGAQRLIGIVPGAIAQRQSVAFQDIQPVVERVAGIRVQRVNWFSTYRVSHRVAEHFRSGRVFISGDAGHIHTPVGGQGMNTGIGDAVNLSWKLAHVLQERADPSLLDSYEVERIAFARSLVGTTDKAFQVMTGRNVAARTFRMLLPHLMPFVLGFSAVQKLEFRTLSQTRIHYRESPISAGKAGDIHGGDRLPWVDAPQGDNFEPLKAIDWQVHVYGAAGQPLRDAVQRQGLALHEFAWSDQAHAAGLERDALYLVRPDGYVALAEAGQDAEQLQRFLAKFTILPRERETA